MNHIFVKNFNSFPELADFYLIADKGDDKYDNIGCVRRCVPEVVQWSSRDYWDMKSETRKFIILNDQTATRSTELACHDRLYCVHSFKQSYNYSNSSQELERVNHYTQKYNGDFQRIKVYGDVKCFKYSAGIITYQQFIIPEYHLKRSGQGYQIRSDEEVHPIYNAIYPKDEAEYYISKIHCSKNGRLTPRSVGTVKSVEKIDAVFIQCNRETFEQLNLGHKNPFIKSDKFMEADPEKYPRANGQIGFLREWRRQEFSFIQENSSYAMKNMGDRCTICYQDGVLGVAYRTHTGCYETKSTIVAKRSMYN